jgi:hypothetical protein
MEIDHNASSEQTRLIIEFRSMLEKATDLVRESCTETRGGERQQVSGGLFKSADRRTEGSVIPAYT